MGQRWSMLRFGHLEESESEDEDSVSLALQPSQATTEASSSVPVFDRGLCPACPNDSKVDDPMVVAFLERLLEFKIVITNNLSNLQSGEVTVNARKKGKEAGTTPDFSISHFSSEKGFLKDSETLQASPSVANYRLRSRRPLDHKPEVSKEALHGKFSIRKIGASSAMQSPSLVSLAPSQSLHVANLLEQAQKDDEVEMLSPVRPIKPEVEKVGGERKQETTSQPLRSPAQTLLLFQLDRKRKPSSGLPNLAFDCTNRVNLKARTPLGRPSKGAAPRGAADLDSRTVDAMVGRCVRKKVEGRGLCKGRVFSYDAAQRIYQIQYDDGKEEALEWLDLKPYLIADSNVIHTESVVERMSLRGQTRLRYKTVNELYTQRKRPGRRVGR